MIRYLERVIPVPGSRDDRQTHHRSVISMIRSDLEAHQSGHTEVAFHVARVDRNLMGVYVRTVDGTAEGFKSIAYDMPEGSLWDLQTDVSVSYTTNVDGKRRERPEMDPDKAHDLIVERIERAGFKVVGLTLGEQKSLEIRRQKGKFVIHCRPITAVVEVDDQATAEASLVSGIGPKRTYGLGMPIVQPIDGGTVQ